MPEEALYEQLRRELGPVLRKEMPTIPKKATKRRELSYKASLETLKAVGIMPSSVQSLVITNIYEQRNLNIHPVVEGVIDKFLESQMKFDGEDGRSPDLEKKE